MPEDNHNFLPLTSILFLSLLQAFCFAIYEFRSHMINGHGTSTQHSHPRCFTNGGQYYCLIRITQIVLLKTSVRLNVF